MKMTKLLFALLLFSSPVMAEETVEEVRWPTYCVRGVVDNGDGTVMLDMPGSVSYTHLTLPTNREV